MLDHFDPTDPIFTFAVALAAVLLVPMLFKRLRLPDIVGLILAGIFLGPHATGIIHEGSFVQPFGTVGLLYLMFMAGLEVDMLRFRRQKRDSVIFGGITFLIPMLIGVVGALFILGMNWAAALLLASMFASHTLLPYPVVQRLGLVKERVVTTAVGGTVFTDTLALLVLAVVAESTRGDLTGLFWVRMTILLALYVAFAFYTIPVVGRWFFRKVSAESVPGFLFVLVFAYAFAAIAPIAGLEPIIGAFLAGLALNLLIPEHSRLMVRLNFVGESFFIPFFLISVGLMVDVALLLQSRGVWVVLVFMVTAAYVAKYLASSLSGRILGFTRDESGLLYGLSVNQTAATLAAVVVGVQLGIFREDVLNGTILMILATCTVGPMVTEKYGRKIAMTREADSLASSGAPERILVPISSRKQIEPLMSLAMMVRNAASGQHLYPAIISPDTHDSEEQIAASEKLLGEAVVIAAEGSTPVQPVTRLAASTVEGIMGASRDLRISTILLDENYGMEGDMEHLPSRIADQGRHLVIRFMNPALINTCSRFLIAVPPLLERQPGFPVAWMVLERLVGQAGAATAILGSRSTLRELEKQREYVQLFARSVKKQVDDWHDIQRAVMDIYSPADLPVLFAARSGRLAWQPSQERLPDQLSKKLGNRPLLIIHPSEMKWEADAAGETPAVDFRAIFPHESVLLKLTGENPEDAVNTMLKSAYPGDAAPDELREDCLRQLEESPLWLSGDCVLVHSHKASPPAPMALLATGENGFLMEGHGGRAGVLLLLLGTGAESPEEHLGRLASIASLFHRSGMIETLKNADSYDEILKEFNRIGEEKGQTGQ